MTDYRILTETPGTDEYRELRVAAGLSPKTTEAAAKGLPASLFSVCARDGDRLIGMGRIVGDGGLNFEIVDMAVHPDYQRQGLGFAMMAALMAYLENEAPESAYVSLIADHGAPALYRKFGFRPTAPDSIGMAIVMPGGD